MAIVGLGITHCSKCCTPLGFGEFGLCTECESKEKELNADEMFEELGYIKDTKIDKILYEKINDEEVNIVCETTVYYKNCYENKNKAIVFNSYCKTVAKCFYDKNDIKFIPNGSFTKDELKVINKKIKELGW